MEEIKDIDGKVIAVIASSPEEAYWAEAVDGIKSDIEALHKVMKLKVALLETCEIKLAQARHNSPLTNKSNDTV